jgi:hypothetical protein
MNKLLSPLETLLRYSQLSSCRFYEWSRWHHDTGGKLIRTPILYSWLSSMFSWKIIHCFTFEIAIFNFSDVASGILKKHFAFKFVLLSSSKLIHVVCTSVLLVGASKKVLPMKLILPRESSIPWLGGSCVGKPDFMVDWSVHRICPKQFLTDATLTSSPVSAFRVLFNRFLPSPRHVQFESQMSCCGTWDIVLLLSFNFCPRSLGKSIDVFSVMLCTAFSSRSGEFATFSLYSE